MFRSLPIEHRLSFVYIASTISITALGAALAFAADKYFAISDEASSIAIFELVVCVMLLAVTALTMHEVFDMLDKHAQEDEKQKAIEKAKERPWWMAMDMSEMPLIEIAKSTFAMISFMGIFNGVIAMFLVTYTPITFSKVPEIEWTIWLVGGCFGFLVVFLFFYIRVNLRQFKKAMGTTHASPSSDSFDTP
jgi:succinate dehydrogenase/fumarate reductase cytochrome b subunit